MADVPPVVGKSESAPAAPVAAPPEPTPEQVKAALEKLQQDRLEHSLDLAFSYVNNAGAILRALLNGEPNTSRGSGQVTVYPFTGASCHK